MNRTALSVAAVVSVSVTLFVFQHYQQQARAAAPMLPVTFAHKTHQGVGCVICHHNYVDDSGQGLCFDCHKTDSAVAAEIESQFHQLCWGCHVEKQVAGDDHGPTRACSACHTADTDP